MTPEAWRPRHEDFAAAVLGLRRIAPERDAARFAAQLHQLTTALQLHIDYEEREVLPRVRPTAGSEAVDAVSRDHDLILGHLAAIAEPVATLPALVERADRLRRLQGVLEHHDEREARHVFPVLEALGFEVDLVEPDLPVAALTEGAPPWQDPDPTGLEGLLRATAQATRWSGQVPLPDHPKAAAIWARVERALTIRGDRVTERDAAITAFDTALQLRWIQSRA